MFSRFFIQRPIFSSVLSIIIVLIGVVAIGALPIARYPQISPPTITVSAMYPGASAATIAETVAAPIEEQVNTKHDQMLRALAEADNARRRAAIDVENARKFGMAKFAKSLLDVADNLGRAADSVPEEVIAENEQLKMLHEGVTMTSTMLLKTFEQHGLQRVDPLGEKFDPNLHNALFEVPDPAQEPGTIAHVQNYGYSLHDRVIRPADVGIVAKR